MDVFESSLTQKNVSEGLCSVGGQGRGAFYENKASELHNPEILNEIKKIKNSSLVTRKLYI